ncbi:MAG: hypothetical protein PHH59_09855 [Methylovulum sp.]|uniref:hypothetical protein n=1 Tax=Methylovulum sp. TaxID=1916980 RepID=UPI002631DBA1|nr:hypothetical protein [Methylovulum sp.]MDD2724310.1 hypothetical protein [Methylovulum sp.]MDD5122957.1 hypothetical protein [Methylovulum sp.]
MEMWERGDIFGLWIEITLIIWVAAFLIKGLSYFIFSEKRQKEYLNTLNAKIRETKDFIRKIPDFNVTDQFMFAGGDWAIAIDESRGKFCEAKREGSSFVKRVISYQEILSSELFEDGELIVKTERSSQIGGAIVGGLLLGGVGTVIGGLSGKKRQQNKINDLTLRIVVNDQMNPLLDIRFLEGETDKNNEFYKYCLETARKWQARMEILIKRAEREEAFRRTETNTVSLPDELKKLAELKNVGVITDEEFNVLKGKMLN